MIEVTERDADGQPIVCRLTHEGKRAVDLALRMFAEGSTVGEVCASVGLENPSHLPYLIGLDAIETASP